MVYKELAELTREEILREVNGGRREYVGFGYTDGDGLVFAKRTECGLIKIQLRVMLDAMTSKYGEARRILESVERGNQNIPTQQIRWAEEYCQYEFEVWPILDYLSMNPTKFVYEIEPIENIQCKNNNAEKIVFTGTTKRSFIDYAADKYYDLTKNKKYPTSWKSFVEILYDQHQFPQWPNWTKGQCYEYSKQFKPDVKIKR